MKIGRVRCEAGFQIHMAKPVDFAELVAVVHNPGLAAEPVATTSVHFCCPGPAVPGWKK